MAPYDLFMPHPLLHAGVPGQLETSPSCVRSDSIHLHVQAESPPSPKYGRHRGTTFMSITCHGSFLRQGNALIKGMQNYPSFCLSKTMYYGGTLFVGEKYRSSTSIEINTSYKGTERLSGYITACGINTVLCFAQPTACLLSA